MKFSLRQPGKATPELLVVPTTKLKSGDALLQEIAALTKVPAKLIQADFSGDLKEVHGLYFTEGNKNKRIALLGLGENPGMKDVLGAFRSFIFKRKSSLPRTFGVAMNMGNLPEEKTAGWVEAATNGMSLGIYDIGLYKTADKSELPLQKASARVDIFVSKGVSTLEKKAPNKGVATAETQAEIFNLVNAPSNHKTPQTLAAWAKSSGKKYGYSVKVFDKKKIVSLGMEALLAVNRGSENPPTFIVMEYKPKAKKRGLKKVGLVGKGVTFDTGGLSIKPSNNMHYMKSDMGGAAAVMGTMEMAAKLQLPVHLMGIVPATDNSVDARSVKPGDVIGSYSGKTIEVIDTDAEGRLILADGLHYITTHFKPDVLMDLATLTGSCIRAIGTYAGGLFSNNDELASDLLAASRRTEERLWQFPMWDDYMKEMQSDVADIKNFSGVPAAGAITAAKFLEFFTNKHPNWAHMDIAGMAIADSEFSSQKGATGFGIRLLVDYLEGLVN